MFQCHLKLNLLLTGGGIRKYRLVDFRRSILDRQGLVLRLEYDPFRRAHIALVQYAALPSTTTSSASETTPAIIKSQLQYILAPQNLKPGDTVTASRTNLVHFYVFI